MKIVPVIVTTLLCFGSVGTSQAAVSARAHSLIVTGAWSRPVPAGLATGVVYMTLSNRAPFPDRLIDASTPVAAKMDLHRSTMVRGRMSMDPVPGGLAIPAGGRVEITPNGYHFMLIGLTQGLKAGAAFPVTLRFAHAGHVKVTVKVLASPPAMAPMASMTPMAPMTP
jgi:copper(I)-binding protein